MIILLAGLFFIKTQIGGAYWVRSATNSKLTQLIDTALAFPEGNPLDELTRNCVLSTTKDRIHRGFTQIMDKEINALITDPQWLAFTGFIENQCEVLKTPKENYPITAVLMPSFGKPLELAGYTIGYTLGEVFARSTFTQSTRISLSAGLGRVLLLLSGGGSTIDIGVRLVAPTYAGILLERYSGVSLAWLLGGVMSLLGKGAGYAVGMPLDMTYQLICHAIATIYTQNSQTIPPLSGFILVNGDYYLKGLKMQAIEDLANQSTLSQIHSN